MSSRHSGWILLTFVIGCSNAGDNDNLITAPETDRAAINGEWTIASVTGRTVPFTNENAATFLGGSLTVIAGKFRQTAVVSDSSVVTPAGASELDTPSIVRNRSVYDWVRIGADTILFVMRAGGDGQPTIRLAHQPDGSWLETGGDARWFVRAR